MSRFRLIVLVCAVVGVVSAIYGSWPRLPELPPAPAKMDIRGPGEMPQNAEYRQWELAKQASTTATAASVVVDGDTIAVIVGALTLMTLLLALLSKYLIAPLILKQINEFMGQVDVKFISKDVVTAHMLLDDARYEAIESQLDRIWERVK